MSTPKDPNANIEVGNAPGEKLLVPTPRSHVVAFLRENTVREDWLRPFITPAEPPQGWDWAWDNTQSRRVVEPAFGYRRPCIIHLEDVHPFAVSSESEQVPNSKDPYTDIISAMISSEHPYHGLAGALYGAFHQAAEGKGKERHANGLAFDKQRMQTLADGLGSTQGIVYQACKKAQESTRMDPAAAVRELQGAVVYLAGAIVWLGRQERDGA